MDFAHYYTWCGHFIKACVDVSLEMAHFAATQVFSSPFTPLLATKCANPSELRHEKWKRLVGWLGWGPRPTPMWSKYDLSPNLALCCLLSCYARRLFQCPVCQEKIDPTKPQQVCIQLKAVLRDGCAVELKFSGAMMCSFSQK